MWSTVCVSAYDDLSFRFVGYPGRRVWDEPGHLLTATTKSNVKRVSECASVCVSE